MQMYDALAPFYAALNSEVDYEGMADFLSSIFKKHFDGEVKDVLDLGCGSGNVTLPLSRHGYGMVGVDISEEMLSEAREKDENADVLWLLQDMRSFELYGTVEATVCTLDGINHLTSAADVKKCLALVHNYLVPNGIFVFDVNSPYKFESVYGTNAYILEADGVFCAWQNTYNPKTRVCRFDVTVFEENSDGTFERYDAATKEKMYTEDAVKKMLKETGFTLLTVLDGYTDSPANEKSERLVFVAKSNK